MSRVRAIGLVGGRRRVGLRQDRRVGGVVALIPRPRSYPRVVAAGGDLRVEDLGLNISQKPSFMTPPPAEPRVQAGCASVWMYSCTSVCQALQRVARSAGDGSPLCPGGGREPASSVVGVATVRPTPAPSGASAKATVVELEVGPAGGDERREDLVAHEGRATRFRLAGSK